MADLDVTTMTVGKSKDLLTGKAIVLYNPTTGEPSAFDASTMFGGDEKYYGVRWFTGTNTNPSYTAGQKGLIRVGSTKLHQELPVQNAMRGCLLDDNGNVVEYLSGGWNDHTLDGSRGQVMVEVPDTYWRFVDNVASGSVRDRMALVSLEPFDGAYKVPKFYVGAYEASLDANSKLCSVAGVLPKTSYSMTSFRTAARKRNTANTKWNILPYLQRKTLFWLYMIEYANRDSQADVNTARDANGFRQGGLGIGVSNVSNWSEYNGYNPFVLCGTSNELGDDSGEVVKNASEYVNNGVTLSTGDSKVHVNRWRGIEMPFGHIWEFTDGIRVNPADASVRPVFVTEDPANFAAGDSSVSGWSNIGNEATEGYAKTLIFGVKGEIMASEVGGGSSTYWCDYHYTANTGIRAVLFGGYAAGGARGGLAYSDSNDAPSNAAARIGSRLCFIP
jgi:hypothetical protein